MASYSDTQTWRVEANVCPNFACWAKSVIIASIVSGIAFAMFQMIFTWFARGSFFMPTRMIAGMLIGREALNPAYPLTTAAPLGMAIHMMLSVVFATIFALILSFRPALSAVTWKRITAGAIFGLVLWVVNFYMIAPLMGWEWFATQTNPWMQGFVAHVFMFGIPLAWLIKRR